MEVVGLCSVFGQGGGVQVFRDICTYLSPLPPHTHLNHQNGWFLDFNLDASELLRNYLGIAFGFNRPGFGHAFCPNGVYISPRNSKINVRFAPSERVFAGYSCTQKSNFLAYFQSCLRFAFNINRPIFGFSLAPKVGKWKGKLKLRGNF